MIGMTPRLLVNPNQQSVLMKYEIGSFDYGLMAWSKKYTVKNMAPSIFVKFYMNYKCEV